MAFRQGQPGFWHTQCLGQKPLNCDIRLAISRRHSDIGPHAAIVALCDPVARRFGRDTHSNTRTGHGKVTK